TYFVIATSANSDVEDPNAFFYARPTFSQLGTYAGNGDQYVQTISGVACNAGTVSGNSPICIGATAQYSSNGDAGGTWSSSSPSVATVIPSTGVVTAVAAGTTNIIYSLSCGQQAQATVTVNPNVSAG